MSEEDNLRNINALAMNIVNQLGDLWEVDVDKRQATNDRADDFVREVVGLANEQGGIFFLSQVRDIYTNPPTGEAAEDVITTPLAVAQSLQIAIDDLKPRVAK